MTDLIPFLTPTQLALAFAIALVAGTVKGMVGFAMPMILIAGLSLFLTPEQALAGLLLPTVVSNAMQAFRHGGAAAWESVRRFRVFLIVGGVFLLLSSQLVTVLSVQTLLLMIGGPVIVFALIQLIGPDFRLARPDRRIEAGVGAIAGFVGGLSGVWGPPTVLYLTALDTPKSEQIRIQGVIYGLGAVALVIAHIGSGVLRAETLPFSVALLVPAIAGMWVGGKLSDQIDQATFRKATLFVLLIVGANLVRRGLMG